MSRRLKARETSVEIGDQIVGMFQADMQAQ